MFYSSYPSKSTINMSSDYILRAVYCACKPLSWGKHEPVYRFLACIGYKFLAFYPDDIFVSDLNKVLRNGKGKKAMASDTIWVFNNMNDEQEATLDADYPTVETVNAWLCELLDSGDSCTLRMNAGGGYVVFINQNKYGMSARSSDPYDALVVGLFKYKLIGGDLSSVADTKPRFRRG